MWQLIACQIFGYFLLKSHRWTHVGTRYLFTKKIGQVLLICPEFGHLPNQAIPSPLAGGTHSQYRVWGQTCLFHSLPILCQITLIKSTSPGLCSTFSPSFRLAKGNLSIVWPLRLVTPWLAALNRFFNHYKGCQCSLYLAMWHRDTDQCARKLTFLMTGMMWHFFLGCGTSFPSFAV